LEKECVSTFEKKKGRGSYRCPKGGRTVKASSSLEGEREEKSTSIISSAGKEQILEGPQEKLGNKKVSYIPSTK